MLVEVVRSLIQLHTMLLEAPKPAVSDLLSLLGCGQPAAVKLGISTKVLGDRDRVVQIYDRMPPHGGYENHFPGLLNAFVKLDGSEIGGARRWGLG